MRHVPASRDRARCGASIDEAAVFYHARALAQREVREMRHTFLALFFLVLIGLTASHTQAVVYLHADFNDKPIDQPILLRGATYGEPYAVDAGAGGFVRSAPMPTPSLEINDGSSTFSCAAKFSFPNYAPITSGVAVLTANLWFAELPGGVQYRVFVSDEAGSTIFVNLIFDNSGLVVVEDMDDRYVEVGQWEIGRSYPIAIAVDLTGHAYDVWFDGQIVRDDVPISVTDQTISIITFAISLDEDLTGLFYVDDIHVTDDPAAVPVGRSTWGRIRGMFRD
jgi:hypothetical protein